MFDQKFIIACLKEVNDKTELDFIWNNMTSYRESDNCFKAKTKLLKKAMGEAKYFDVPSDPKSEYYCIEAMFLSFEWKYASKFQQVKDLVNELL